MKKRLTALAVGMLLVISSRSLHLPESVFYIRNDGARMPVVIRGNATTQKLIIFLHGGPGGTAMKKIGCKAFLAIESSAEVVYWDQRGSVFTEGGDDKKYLTLEQFVDDLDHLVDTLRLAKPQHSIFLMGHCWGGALAVGYLADEIRHAKISGWIDVAGAHNNPMGDRLSTQWVKAYAHEQISINARDDYWRKVIRWYGSNPTFTSANLNHYMHVKKAKGYVHAASNDNGLYPGYNSGDLVTSPFEFLRYHLNYQKILNRFIISDLDLTPQMKNITVPSLIIWGKEDGLIPVAMAQHAYDALGTDIRNKQIVLLENTAHTSFYVFMNDPGNFRMQWWSL
jgi:proline iminopeptidase